MVADIERAVSTTGMQARPRPDGLSTPAASDTLGFLVRGPDCHNEVRQQSSSLVPWLAARRS